MKESNLYNLIRRLIALSKTMKRFVTAPQYGVELNKNNLGEILKDVLGGIKDGPKYPLCIMFPPTEIPNYDSDWSRFKCRMFFLDQQYNDEDGTAERNPFNNLSEKTIEENWQEMSSAAKDFRKVFIQITDENLALGIRDAESVDVIDRYSDVANDRLAGVGISFDVELFLGCELEDYDPTEIENFKL